jgi:beta-glucosidase
MTRMTFPPGFVWGAATSAYQIEGAVHEDGRGESIWDRFSRTPNKVEDGTTGDVACDHYHRWKDDVALMKRLGLCAYRFSIAWPRIVPQGTGAPNARGLDFYSKLVDQMLALGIEPYVTLYHWDLPQVLQDVGGWANRATAEAFVRYAEIVARTLGDRVKYWITHNEPWCASVLGYRVGRHAPGISNWNTALAAAHHLLLSHGWSVPVIRREVRDAKVGITLNLTPTVPASSSFEDYDAARHFDGHQNRWFLDPLYRGHYPADMLADYIERGHLLADGLGVLRPGDMKDIAAPTDFLGVNYYNRSVIRSDRIPEERNARRTVHLAPESEWTEMGWEVFPEGLFQILERLKLEYMVPKIFVTENGASYSEGPDEKGRIADGRRVKFVRNHLIAARRAIEAGIPLAGYFVWSLLDNFEWERGYTQRFGITWVDYKTQERVPKDCALWYRSVIQENGLLLED